MKLTQNTMNSQAQNTTRSPKQLSSSIKASLYIKALCKWTAISSLSAFALGLTACQSTSGMTQSMTALPQPQLLNLAGNPSPSATAKARFVNAMKLHMASEQLSTSVVQYSMRPFVAEDSVDGDSQSIFQTAIETYLYSEAQKNKVSELEEEAMVEQYIEEVEAEIAEAKGNGDDSYDDYTDEDIREEAEYRYLVYTYEQEYEESESSDELTGFFKSYMQMKREQVEKELNPELEKELEDNNTEALAGVYSSRSRRMAKELLNMLYRTPEQIEAMQAHSLDYFSMQMIGHHQPAKMSYQAVLSYDFASPTQTISAQLPVGIDFKQANATVDPSVVLPIVAIFAPDKLTLPKDMQSHTVTFTLPDEIRKKVPTEAIYTAFLEGVDVAFSEMDSEYFTSVDISGDEFARKVGARRVVKVYWGSKETGEFLGKVLKSMSQNLQAYVSEHPEPYQDEVGAETLQEVLTAWSLIERDFQSKDVGGLLQVIEAVAPINFQQSTYYYLGNDDRLKAYQSKMSFGSELYGWTMDGVQQTRYDLASVQASPLYSLYVQDFGANASETINGNEWFEGKSDSELQRQARYARYDYPEWETLEHGYEAATATVAATFAGDDLQFDDAVSEEERARRAFAVYESGDAISSSVESASEGIEMLEYDSDRPRNKKETRDKWEK